MADIDHLKLNEAEEITKLEAASQEDLASIWRYSKVGHPYFNDTYPYYEIIKRRFKGFTPSISKAIGCRCTPTCSDTHE